MRTHDLIIIGAGSGNSIIGAEHDDLDVAIVERGLFGGTCLNVGCIPSKMFVYAAEVAELADRVGPALGVRTSFAGADWTAIRDRVFDRIDPIAKSGADYRDELPHVTVYRDHARFVGPKEIEVGATTITAETIVIAAGARPFVPRIQGLEDIDYHTSDTIMRLDVLPARLAVIGAGYIAAELGNVFGMLGSEVTFILRSDTFLRREDTAISTRFTELYRRKHATRTRSAVRNARRDGDEIVLELSGRHDGEELRVDTVLIATGRIPNSDQLDLAAHGYTINEAGHLQTDEYRRTGVAGVWALGDITNPVQLKHVANHEARVVAHNIANPGDLRSVGPRLDPTRRLWSSAGGERWTHRGRLCRRRSALRGTHPRVLLSCVRLGDGGHRIVRQANHGSCEPLADRRSHHRPASLDTYPATNPRHDLWPDR